MPTSFASTRPIVRIAGADGGPMEQATLEVTVTMDEGGMDHAELRVVNWAPAPSGQIDFAFASVRLGDDIEVVLGEGAGDVVFRGHVTALEERYGDGAPQLVILAEDPLHQLARIRHSREFADTSIDDVIGQLATDAGLTGDAEVSSTPATYHQLNESNLALLRRLIAPYDVAIRLVDGTTLRVGPPEPSSDPVVLDAQDNATAVRVIADLNRQYAAATAAGFDPAAGEAITSTADAVVPAPPGETALDQLGSLGWDAVAFVTAPFAVRQTDAEAYATSAVNRAAGRFVHAQITCEGNPALRPATEVELAGVSPRFAGVYSVQRCIHHFDGDQGYQTQLELARPNWTP